MKWDQSCVIDWCMFICLFIYCLNNDVILEVCAVSGSNLQTRWPVFHLRPVRVGFVMHEVVLEQIFLRLLLFCTIIIKLILHFPLLFLYC